MRRRVTRRAFTEATVPLRREYLVQPALIETMFPNKLLAILADPTVKIIVVEHKDRLTRFGFKYIETLLAMQGRSIEVVNITENPIEDLIADMVSILYSFSARLYGQRRAKRKTEHIVKELELQAQTQKGGEKDAVS